MTEYDIFVPGRLGIIGEVSDLVTPYLEENNKLIPGCAIAMTVEQGIYATVKESSNLVITMNDKKFTCEMNEDILLKHAEDKNNFFAYVCGCSLYMKRKYNIGGINVKITKMDLPIKKGLSSSAAICVLITKAYKKVYNLEMSEEEEIEAAYQGEHLALSKCGKLDQSVIYKNQLVKVDFYSNEVNASEILPKEKIHILVADLKGDKDTAKIMSDLNNCFPFYKNDNEKKVHQMVSLKNRRIVQDSVNCIEIGDLKKLGKNFRKMQKLKDKCSVVCSEFESPKLHSLLRDKTIKKLSYGAKDVGSGGDGCIEILAKNEQSKEKLKKYLENDLGLTTYSFTIDNKNN